MGNDVLKTFKRLEIIRRGETKIIVGRTARGTNIAGEGREIKYHPLISKTGMSIP